MVVVAHCDNVSYNNALTLLKRLISIYYKAELKRVCIDPLFTPLLLQKTRQQKSQPLSDSGFETDFPLRPEPKTPSEQFNSYQKFKKVKRIQLFGGKVGARYPLSLTPSPFIEVKTIGVGAFEKKGPAGQ